MPLIKKVQNANPGNADLYGGNDLDTVSDYFNDTDTGNVPRINNPTEYRSGILKFRDSTNTYNVVMKSAAQTNSRDFTIPALAGNDSPATLALANTYTDVQTVTKDAADLLKLYRPASTTNNLTGLTFQHRNSNNVQTDFAKMYGKLITNTSGLEDGKFEWYVKKGGVDTLVMSIDKNGLLTCTSLSVSPPNPNAVTVLLNSGATVTTSSTNTEFDMLNYTVLANTLGTNGALRCHISGYILQNQASATDYTMKIKFGTTIIFQELFAAVPQVANNKPFVLDFTIGNKNATNSQGLSGYFKLQDANTPVVGEGSLVDDEQLADGNFRAATGASTKDTTSNQVLQVTMTMSISNANAQTSVQRKIIELIPTVT